jgi:hypothetical protein
MRPILVVAFVLFAACASAQSQPPSPGGGGEETKPQPKQTQPTQTQPGDTRGSESNPIIVRSIRSESESAENQQDRDGEKANRRYSLWLSVITTLVLGFQIWLLVRQNDIIGKQSAIMEGQRTAADKQSSYMREGLEHTKTAADAAKESANTARDALVLTQRGRLSVESAKAEFRKFNEGPPIRLHVTIVFRNVGPTLVTVTESMFDSVFGHPDDLPDKWEFDRESRKEDFPVAQGDTFEQIKWLPFASEADILRFKDGKDLVFLFGYAKYTNIIEPNRVHTTRYSRSYNLARKRTAVVQKPGYNYAD